MVAYKLLSAPDTDTDPKADHLQSPIKLDQLDQLDIQLVVISLFCVCRRHKACPPVLSGPSPTRKNKRRSTTFSRAFQERVAQRAAEWRLKARHHENLNTPTVGPATVAVTDVSTKSELGTTTADTVAHTSDVATTRNLNPSKKRRASTTERELCQGLMVMPNPIQTTSTQATHSDFPGNMASAAFASCWKVFCAPFKFVQRQAIAAADHLFQHATPTPAADESFVKRRKIPPGDDDANLNLEWADNATDCIGISNIELARDALRNAVEAVGVNALELSNLENTYQHIQDAELRRAVCDVTTTIKVIETIYLSPDFLHIYKADSPNVRSNPKVVSETEAEDILRTASDLILSLCLGDGQHILAPHFSLSEQIADNIWSDITALTEGRVPPSLIAPVKVEDDNKQHSTQPSTLDGPDEPVEPRITPWPPAESTFPAPIFPPLENPAVTQFFKEFNRSALSEPSVAPSKPFVPTQVPKVDDIFSHRRHVVGILRKTAPDRITTPKRLRGARAMKRVKFISPLISKAPLPSRPPRVDAKRGGWYGPMVRTRDLRVTHDNKPGIGQVSVNGEKVVSVDDIVTEREQKIRDEQERIRKAEEELRRIEEEKKKAEEERINALKHGGLRAAKNPIIMMPTKQILQEAHNTMNPQLAGQILSESRQGTELRGKDFQTLVGRGAWLNDEMVNTPLDYFIHHINIQAGRDPKRNPKCAFVGSLSAKFLQGAREAKFPRSLSRCHITPENFLGIDSILIPLCSGNHWTLAAIRPGDRSVTHLDSLSPNGRMSHSVIEFALKIVKAMMKDKFLESEWKQRTVRCTQQNNSYDCGMHTIMNGICIASGVRPDQYETTYMVEQRCQIAAVLLRRGFEGIYPLDNI